MWIWGSSVLWELFCHNFFRHPSYEESTCLTIPTKDSSASVKEVGNCPFPRGGLQPLTSCWVPSRAYPRLDCTLKKGLQYQRALSGCYRLCVMSQVDMNRLHPPLFSLFHCPHNCIYHSATPGSFTDVIGSTNYLFLLDSTFTKVCTSPDSFHSYPQTRNILQYIKKKKKYKTIIN